VYAYQRPGVANGTYTPRARGERGGTVTACYLEAEDYGGAAKTVNLPTNGWGEIEITDINVTNGAVTNGAVTIGL
jgi:hypothetical protein